MQRFTQIAVWQRAREVAVAILRLSRGFPASEGFQLTSQLRRAATSVPANIAEGSKRRSNRDYAYFLNIAEASAGEAEYFLILARDLGDVNADQVMPIFPEISKGRRHALPPSLESGSANHLAHTRPKAAKRSSLTCQ